MLPDVIILNGTGSSGKTSIAKQLQERLPYQFLNFSIDAVLYSLPPSDLQAMMEGRPIDRQGYDYAQLVEGYHRCIPSLLESGVKLILDNAWVDKEEYQQLRSLLSYYTVCTIGVKCDLDVAKKREKARGDRAIGLAEYEFPLVHQGMDYDFVIDSSHRCPQELAQDLLHQLTLSSFSTA
ncbi:chloramphenicol phosphotransferase CPT family protein [Vibrio genomosp. F10]|uniref:Chloramphenicol phosphotransferase n=2 Tax=Vibrio genomosp. F10 TaxID=723171 RepID=A0A1B9R2E6_9VIBR|nr:AAA family ATPase [Vibrio genomosp. F10]OCH78440.1 chloramphenicol phosphotransferase [Vibrio genomosp. F10]OEE30837.1 chloramphenicol phosphotransferase [Vibrio genomosp. F10 str. ZF-129]OEE87478.1 chloramphenicol phosphotransferase [Vibrio genomosp. F10 str. 9ZD137]OEE98074.1 chloramphenicol phosphotransferase [Vibrio genomosp. F10 str. 9ZC157]